jgi:RHS repeat-associated protein
LNFDSTDVSGQAFGASWAHTRTYGNLESDFVAAGHGVGWFIAMSFARAYPAWSGSSLSCPVVLDRQRVLYFNNDETGIVHYAFNGQYIWEGPQVPESTQEIRVIGPSGQSWVFYGTDPEVPLDLQGRLKEIKTPDGNVQTLTYTDGLLTFLQEMREGIVGEFEYTWTALPAGSGEETMNRLSTVTLRVAGVEVGRALYTYHHGDSPQGRQGELQNVVREVIAPGGSGWVRVGESYYTYCQPGEPYPEGLRFILEAEAVARLRAAGYDPATVPDEVLAQFADFALTYDAQRRVVLEVLRGGVDSHAYEYFTRFDFAPQSAVFRPAESSHSSSSSESSHAGPTYPIETNFWRTKTIETLSDGTQNVVYCNQYGQVMMQLYAAGGQQWAEAYRFGLQGAVVLRATSAAVAPYDDSLGSLFTLRRHAGLIERSAKYYLGPNPDHLVLVVDRGLGEGEETEAILVSESVFMNRSGLTDGSDAVYYLAQQYNYAADALTPDPTSYAYTFFDSAAISQQTTTWPVVPSGPTGQNGRGGDEGDRLVEVFAPNGRRTWMKDERGFISQFTYDAATGAPRRTVRDYNTSASSSSGNSNSSQSSSSAATVPDGWETPEGGGLNLVTDYEHDSRGRTTQALGPWHEIDLGGTATMIRPATWTVYRDDTRETWTGRGYARAHFHGGYDYTLLSPVEITRTNYNGQATARITAIRTFGTGRLLYSTVFYQNSWCRWQSTLYDQYSRLVSQRLYHLIPTEGEGEPRTNYAQTEYGYDSRQRQIKVRSPEGTITRTVLSPKGWPLGTWVGTDDTGATFDNPPGIPGTTNNMVQLAANVYDDGLEAHNGNLTQTTAFAGAEDLRVTTFTYDYRNRRLSTAGELSFFESYTYDNADRIIRAERYNGSHAEENLIARSETAYDTRGRVYKTTRYGVAPTGGTVSVTDEAGNPAERYAYDAFGNSIVLNTAWEVQAGSFLGWETRFGSYRWDQETGLYCVRQRYLHSQLGRWFSRDPLGETQGIELYLADNNSPSNFVDPSGNAVVPDPWQGISISPDEELTDPLVSPVYAVPVIGDLAEILDKLGAAAGNVDLGSRAIIGFHLEVEPAKCGVENLQRLNWDKNSPHFKATYWGTAVYHERAHGVNGKIAYEHSRDGIKKFLDVCLLPAGIFIGTELAATWKKRAYFEENYEDQRMHLGETWGGYFTNPLEADVNMKKAMKNGIDDCDAKIRRLTADMQQYFVGKR